jgi:hypothetical protein
MNTKTVDSTILSDEALDQVTGGNWFIDGLLFEAAKAIGEAAYHAIKHPREAPYNVEPDGFVG